MPKPRKVYIVNREDLFKIQEVLPKTSICGYGPLWLNLYLTEEDVFTLWCVGVKAWIG